MKITFNIDYKTLWGQNICICGSLKQLGDWDESLALELHCTDISKWGVSLEIDDNAESFEYYYFVKENDKTVRKETGETRRIPLKEKLNLILNDYWKDFPQQNFLYASAFTEGFFPHKSQKVDYAEGKILFKLSCPYAKKDQEVIVCGETDVLGNWNPSQSPKMRYTGNAEWEISLNVPNNKTPVQFKFAILDRRTNRVTHWEEGENRILDAANLSDKNIIRIDNFAYRHSNVDWKAAGVVIPVFSLRSKESFGIGEFSDLHKMIDWAEKSGLKIIQTLPINDTTISYTWKDSYPYNAISIYALHPIYLGLNRLPLKDKKKLKQYMKEAQKLNELKDIDYEKVIKLKTKYLHDLFQESGSSVVKSKEFEKFLNVNKTWLFPYAFFCYFRDKYKTVNYNNWKEDKEYDINKLEKLIENNETIKTDIDFVFFTQYLLHKQLSEAKEYAHSKNVILKGDIPIGINRHSVETWTEPHLFNLDTQTGAPPDGFSVYGQNWGFPTYNWEEMAKDNYSWWTKRFKKMADYFDAYRTDHILGFFRIWEIPDNSIQGLLGCFSPALPLTLKEIEEKGFKFDKQSMTNPSVDKKALKEIFGKYTDDVIGKYLTKDRNKRFKLKKNYDTQLKIKNAFEKLNGKKSDQIREGLYKICNEVLFIEDKRTPDKFHPRIVAQQTYSFNNLDETAKNNFDELYNDFFYHRHTQFWKEEALRKLPTLISSTRMLVCGEDLGMIPDCVPEVMSLLQILTLEIERMPKENGRLFTDLKKIPYLSVCSTSTHDISTIRLWWKENPDITQKYYNEVLLCEGVAPKECTIELCEKIIFDHLGSSSLLAIFPLQDWLAINEELRNPEPQEERINIPSEPNHYWRYRMHIYLEDMLENESLSNQILSLLEKTERLL
ncbi:MAG: 4-alpha-glucanotransferase [Dysgonomonas sp.]